MADVTLRTDRFPQGANVSVYPQNARLADRAPSGTATAGPVAVAADQTVAFTGLPDNTAMTAYALVGSEHRYVNFHTAPEGAAGAARRDADNSFSGRVGFNGAPPVGRASAVASPSGGTTVDAQARTAIDQIRAVLKNVGLTS